MGNRKVRGETVGSFREERVDSVEHGEYDNKSRSANCDTDHADDGNDVYGILFLF